MINAAGKGFLDVIKVLLEFKADPNLKRVEGESAISWAAYNEQEAVIQYLVTPKFKVNIDAQNNEGTNSLMWAAQKNFGDIVEILIDAGCNVNLVNENDNTALGFAKVNGYTDIETALIAAGASEETGLYSDPASNT